MTVLIALFRLRKGENRADEKRRCPSVCVQGTLKDYPPRLEACEGIVAVFTETNALAIGGEDSGID